jgi:O-antigen/teichoic acid export membrane protein
MATRSVRGSLVLFVGNFLAIAMTAITSIVIARLLGPDLYGFYSLALVIPSLLQLFVGFGVNASITRYSAYQLSLGNREDARRYTRNAIIFLLLVGVLFTLVDIVTAGVLSSFLLQRPDLGPYVQLVSLAILGTTLLQAVTAAAIGWNRFALSSLTTILQSVAKLALSPALILIGFGVLGALVAQVASYAVAGVLGGILLLALMSSGSSSGGSFISDVREMLKYGLPVYAGTLLTGLAAYYVSIILAAIASNTTYGYYQTAYNFTQPINIISSATIGALFPTFAAIDGMGGDPKAVFRHVYKFIAFLMTPLVGFLAVSAPVLVTVLYGSSYSGSAELLTLLSLANLPVALGYNVHPAFFNGFNRTRLTMYLGVASGTTLAILAPVLAIYLGLGVPGLIYSIFISYLTGWTVGVVFAYTRMSATIDSRPVVMILLATTVASGAVYLMRTIPINQALLLVVELGIYLGIYVTLAPALKAITLWDAEILDKTFREIRVVGRLAVPLLRYVRYVIRRTASG